MAAEKAAKAGLRVVLFEKKELGGTCLNEGCIPTKTILNSAKIFDHAVGGDSFGVVAEGVKVDYAKVQKRKERVVRRLVGGVAASMRGCGVEVVKGEALIEGRDPLRVRVGETVYEAEDLLICSGSSPAVPPIPGAADVMDSTAALALDHIPESVAVIGGGVIGMEFASFYRSFGAEVDVFEMMPKILGPMDGEVSRMLMDIYSKKGVRFHLGCRVKSLEGGKVIFEDADGTEGELVPARILMCVGRRPNLQGYGLETLGVQVDRGIKVDEFMCTGVEGVYAAGDVTGFSMLAHTASREGEVAVEDILRRRDPSRPEVRMDYRVIPGVVYTNPEVAGVGLTEEQAPEGARVLRLPMLFSGRFAAENDRTDGICKIIADGDRILGVHILGNGASEIIHGCCLAMQNGLGLKDVCRTVFPHPTVSEIVRLASGL